MEESNSCRLLRVVSARADVKVVLARITTPSLAAPKGLQTTRWPNRWFFLTAHPFWGLPSQSERFRPHRGWGRPKEESSLFPAANDLSSARHTMRTMKGPRSMWPIPPRSSGPLHHPNVGRNRSRNPVTEVSGNTASVARVQRWVLNCNANQVRPCSWESLLYTNSPTTINIIYMM